MTDMMMFKGEITCWNQYPVIVISQQTSILHAIRLKNITTTYAYFFVIEQSNDHKVEMGARVDQQHINK